MKLRLCLKNNYSIKFRARGCVKCEIKLDGLEVVYKKPSTLTETPFHYCPGCGHSVVHRLIMEVVEEMEFRIKL